MRRKWRIIILSKLLILLVSLSFSQFAAADIATDIADGVKTHQATQNAKDSNVTAEDAVVALIAAGINSVEAVAMVSNSYALSPAEKDSVITAAINALPPGTDIAPLVALYSSQGPEGISFIASFSGGGTPVSPNQP